MKLIVAVIIAFAIGFACRWFDIPVPAPPALQGVLLIVAITVGYLVADKIAAPSKETRLASPSAVSQSESRTADHEN